jgi:transposase
MERLPMNQIRDLVHRLRQGESQRQIARDLGLSRVTVKKYVLLAEEGGYLGEGSELPSGKELEAKLGPAPAPPRRDSSVDVYREVVERLLDQGLEMTAICSRLRENHGYTGSYSAVKRFVHRVRPEELESYVRVHTKAGEEAQVDFGSAGKMLDRNAVARQAHAFVMTLGYSRHQYAELVFDQKIATWIGLHQRAFAWFGGVPGRIVLDNLKAGVVSASVDDPVLGEAYRRLAQHYGFVVSPNRPRTPNHKGKVESGVGYLKGNFLAGQEFGDLRVANERLRTWVLEVAGARVHGTTKRVPLQVFEAEERSAMGKLPEWPFGLCEIKLAKLHPDCHVTLDGSYYSAPYQYVGQALEAYIWERVVELYRGFDLVATHIRAEKRGTWRTQEEHYHPAKAAYLQRTPQWCRELASGIGPSTLAVVEGLLGERPLDRLRSVQALLGLERSVGRERLELACRRALHFGDGSYRRVKDILNAALDQEPIPGETLRPVGRRSYVFAREWEEFFGTVRGVGHA